MTRFLAAILLFVTATLVALTPATAEVTERYASIVVDADSLEILHARQIDEQRFPASLTKVMTIVMLFDALEAGDVTLDTEMSISKTAARTSPTKLYLKAGETIRVEDAILGLAVKSANDAAVVVAEHLSGSVDQFAIDMTERAQSLGMKSTVFKTPNGLPDPEQVTTARDMAKLASAVLRTYPDYYSYFGQKTFRYKGATYKNTNGLLHSLAGVDGFKTGFTNASGYNLIISAERDGRRIIAVVLGGASGKSRNAHMTDLIDRSFARMGVEPVVSAIAEIEDTVQVDVEPVPAKIKVTKALSLRRSDGSEARIVKGRAVKGLAKIGTADWSIRVGRFENMPGARDQLAALFNADPALTPDNAVIQPTTRGFESRFTSLSFDAATQACAQLSGLAGGCSLIAPSRAR